MADAHNRKAGNKGDVWKHFVLTAVVDALVTTKNADQSFSYVDTHCSLGTFSLVGTDEWKKGIGGFFDKDWKLADHPYFEIERRAYDQGKYLGSWTIVKELLRSHGLKGDLRLFDISDSVAKALNGEAGYSQSSGFQAVLSGSRRPDLILCDPAYSEQRERDWRSIRDFASRCNGDNLAALIWYPVFVKEPPLAAFAENVIAEVRWPCRGANQMMRGCGMIALGPAGQVVRAIESDLLEVAEALGGSVTRRPATCAV
jgi:23S rRNA A2030 N6-methylase RlmJ